MKNVKILAIHAITYLTLVSLSATPVFSKTFVAPHVLEKKQVSVGIKEEGVKKTKDSRDTKKTKQKTFLPRNFKKTTDKATPKLQQKIKAPRDAATGQSTGKRQHKPLLKTNLNSSRSNRAVNLNSSKSNKQKVTTPRDAATGHTSGKRTSKQKSDTLKTERDSSESR